MIAREEEASSATATAASSMSRKAKRKAGKKEKRKQKRKEVAEKERQEEEARLNDPEEQLRFLFEEEKEKERLERERREFEERERLFLEALARKKAQEEEEEEQRRALLEEEQIWKEQQQVGHDMELNEDEEWEYVEEGPPEIIWKGNEIIVKKNRVRVKKKSADQQLEKEDQTRPISNPLPPQSEAFADYKNASTMLSAQQLLDNVAQQTPNFGTEQDKAHCPFHLKTGACRFGARCSRVHFYPDQSCTLLVKNMYNGPGLAWEQDEGLEYTEEEVEHCFEEFYEDVHTEFLKFGEIVNFKVCRNGSYHLRGNVYIHYKSLESAMLAYHSINGRYFAGKQVNCEFVAVTRWKVAICGEYMKSNLKICSRGSACNFIHCFRNPGGDYEWADWDKPPPRFWVEKMAALFGYSDQFEYDKQIGQETPGRFRDSSKRLMRDRERYRYRRSKSKEIESSNRCSSDPCEEDHVRRTKIRHTSDDKRGLEVLDRRECRGGTCSRHHRQPGKKRSYDSESETDLLDGERNADMHRYDPRKRSKDHQKELYDSQEACSIGNCYDSVSGTDSLNRKKERHRHEEHREKSSRQHEVSSRIVDNSEHKKGSDSTDSSKGQSYEGRDSTPYNDRQHRRSCDFDYINEWSDGITERCREYGRKSSRRRTEASKLSDDYRESHNISSNKSHGKESEQMKSELCSVQKRSSSDRKDRLGGKNVEVESTEHIRSDEEHMHMKSSQYDRISKSYDSDFSYGTCKMGSVESKEDLLNKSKRKFSCDEDIDRRGRWEATQVDSEKRHGNGHGRKSSSKDDEHHIGSGSRDQTSDEYSKEDRSGPSGGSSKSSNKKHGTSSKETNPWAMLKESNEDGKIHERKYRSHGSKRHTIETSS